MQYLDGDRTFGNTDNIDSFLMNNEKFKLIEDQSVDPDEFNDGFYMAKLQRIA